MENQNTQQPPVIGEQSTVNTVTPSTVHRTQNSFLIILLSSLLIISVAIAGFFAYQTQKLVAEVTGYREQLKQTPIAKPTVEPVATNSSEVNPTANWKTFTNLDFTYKYPNEWKIGQDQTAIISDIVGAGITNFKKDMPMYNECMKKDKTDVNNGLMIKYYSYDLGTEACSNQSNINNKEIWVTKDGGDGYQPGIIFDYNIVIYPKSISIFDQILSTFKFTD